jgi:hypothetical protein
MENVARFMMPERSKESIACDQALLLGEFLTLKLTVDDATLSTFMVLNPGCVCGVDVLASLGRPGSIKWARITVGRIEITAQTRWRADDVNAPEAA